MGGFLGLGLGCEGTLVWGGGLGGVVLGFWGDYLLDVVVGGKGLGFWLFGGFFFHGGEDFRIVLYKLFKSMVGM